MHEKQCVYYYACRSFSQYLSPFSLVTHTDTLSDGCREIRLCDIVSWHIAITDAASWSGLFPPAQFATKCLLLVSDDWILTSSPLWLHTQQCAKIHNSLPLTYLGLLVIHVYVCSILTLTFLACVSSITGQAKAEEWINLVDASASIFTWLWLAVIDVCEEEKKRAGGLKISLGFKLKGCILLKRCCS